MTNPRHCAHLGRDVQAGCTPSSQAEAGLWSPGMVWACGVIVSCFFLEGGRVWAFQPGKESPKSIKGQVSEPAGKAPPRRPGPAPGAPGAAPPTVRAAPRTSGPRLPGATERLDPLEAGPPIQIQSPQSSFPMVLAPPRGGGCGGNDPLPSPRTDYKHR